MLSIGAMGAEVYEGPAFGTAPGGTVARIVVTVADAPVTIFPTRATTTPVTDDIVSVAGFGTETGFDPNSVTEGDLRVTRVTRETAFSADPVGEVRSCTNDAVVFDDTGALTGLIYAGVPDPTGTPCFASSIGFWIAPMADFIDTTLALPLPEETDGGMPDGDVPDAAPDAAADTTPPGDAGGGGDDGGCSSAGPVGLPAVAVCMLGLVWWSRRRLHR